MQSNWLVNEINTIPVEIFLMFVLALILTGRGFFQTVHFISTGYGFSIAGMALVSMFYFRSNLAWYSIIHNLLLAAYGLRLGFFLIWRETKPDYRNAHLNNDETKRLSLSRNIVIWITVSILYTFMFLPSLLSLTAGSNDLSISALILQLVGMSVMLSGILIESVSDYQKSAFKAKYPKQFCNTGLFKIVRCPNYFGEIIFWIGNFVMGMAFLVSIIQWILGLIGLVCIVLIMLGSAKRLEKTQQERYGNRPEFNLYAKTVPILIPLIPLYSLQKLRVYLE
jgi:steroid 5-alpha reductase family enzyme